jgi:hypothetical protein
MNPFKVGDTVERISGKYQGMVAGDIAVVIEVDVMGIKFKAYKGNANGLHSDDAFKLVTPTTQQLRKTKALSATKVAVAIHPTCQGQYSDDPVEGADDGMDYDERKAAAPVCSLGKFKAGDVLVYRDGTPMPNGETRTVKTCTATCVWFEETYSMPFSPDEFINNEDYYG